MLPVLPSTLQYKYIVFLRSWTVARTCYSIIIITMLKLLISLLISSHVTDHEYDNDDAEMTSYDYEWEEGGGDGHPHARDEL